MRTQLKCVLFTAAAFGLAACGEATDPSAAGPSIPEPSLARPVGACSTASLMSPARSYFSSPEQQTSTDLLRSMEDSCVANDKPTAIAGGWTILGTIESVLEAGTGGSAADGAVLANGLINYMCGLAPALCAAAPAPVSTQALGAQGIFAVRMGGTDDIVAHGPVGFTDFEGIANQALWGLETSTNWASATGASKILVYGTPGAASSLSLDELSFGDLAYDLHTFPDVPGFKDGELHVGVCYKTAVGLPHQVPGDNSTPDLGERLQREGTILQGYQPGCAGWWQTQTAALDRVMRGLVAFADWAFLPQPLHAAFMTDRKAPSTGGTPIDFSHFAPIAANTSGSLVFVTPPQDGKAGRALKPIVVQALSGEGTPMELVKVQIYVDGNQGSPAGATFCETTTTSDCNDTAFTIEALTGYGTVATFDKATLYKPGGYMVCVKALDSAGADDFSFTPACAPMFHIKN